MSATFPQPGVADQVAAVEASAELARGYELGRSAWPDIALPAHHYAAAVARALSGDDAASIEALVHRDLYVATAAAAGDALAIAAVETHYFRGIPLLLEQMKEHAITAAEVCSKLRERLLVPRPDRAPGIASYRGRGSLAGWLRVTAGRIILELRKREHRELYAQPESLLTIAASESDPELLYLKKLYRSEFKQAFERAVATLDARQRNLLRYQVVHGLGIDRIAAIHGTHRSTAARWLVKARAELTRRTRDELAAKLRLDEAELESIYRLIQSQMDVSLASVLA